MAATLHDAHHQRGSPGIPHQTVDHPPETPDALLLDTDVAERRCWRCLHMFPDDPTQAPTLTPQWWLCEPCDRILLGSTLRAA